MLYILGIIIVCFIIGGLSTYLGSEKRNKELDELYKKSFEKNK